jgi:hypothetical protein
MEDPIAAPSSTERVIPQIFAPPFTDIALLMRAKDLVEMLDPIERKSKMLAREPTLA